MNLNQKDKHLVSFGDKIFNGEYYLHSKFKNSINFYSPNNDRLITIGNKKIGSGPSNIIFDGFDQSIKKISIFNDKLFLDKNEYNLDKNKVYNSTLEIEKFDLKKFYSNLSIFEGYLRILAYGKGLEPLIEEKELKKDNLMDKVLIRIKNGIETLFNIDLIEGINEIKGVGIGLTPSGDDFIYGFLTGLKVFEIIRKEDNLFLRRLIYNSAKGDNIISNNFLYYASEGHFFEKTKNLILSLFYGDEGEIFTSTTSILQIGETSGVDFSVGFLTIFKKGGLNGSKRIN